MSRTSCSSTDSGKVVGGEACRNEGVIGNSDFAAGDAVAGVLCSSSSSSDMELEFELELELELELAGCNSNLVSKGSSMI